MVEPLPRARRPANAAFVWGTFGSVFVLQSAFYEPPRSVLTGGLALVAAVAHVGMVLAWGDQGVK